MAASTINIECKRYGCVKNLLACYGNCRYTNRCDDLRNELVEKTAAAEADINRYLGERGRLPILVQILKRGVKFGERAERPTHKPVKPMKAVKSSVITAKSRLQDERAVLSVNQPSLPGPLKNQSKKPKLKTGEASQAKAAKAISATKRRQVIRPATPVAPQPSKAGVVAQSVSAVAPRITSSISSASAPTRPRKSRSRKRSTVSKRAKPFAKANVSVSEGPATLTVNPKATPTRPEAGARPAGERVAPRRKTATKSRKAAAGKVYLIIEGQTATIVDEQGLMMHLFSNHSKTTRYFEASEVEARVQIVPKR